VIAKDEMVGKLRAALDARQSDGFLIIARTDAVAVEGFEAALDRASAYAEAGADMLFVDALESEDQMRSAVAAVGGNVPLMANMVEGGKTPARSVAELQDIGFSLVIFPGGVVRAIAATMRDYYDSLIANGSTVPFRERMLDFDGLNAMIGTAEMVAAGRTYDEDTD
jgi:2-methylisocitrate lyase-like PEP mutase family enzyme